MVVVSGGRQAAKGGRAQIIKQETAKPDRDRGRVVTRAGKGGKAKRASEKPERLVQGIKGRPSQVQGSGSAFGRARRSSPPREG